MYQALPVIPTPSQQAHKCNIVLTNNIKAIVRFLSDFNTCVVFFSKHIAFQPTVGFASIARIAQVVHKNTCLLCKLNSNTMKSDYAIAAEKLQKQQLRGL